MSYTKTTWVNNTTPINDTNLNKIEQGIYDNSLVVDAITNTLNPTDTETYKTAELTEGQITDVIGVNDIVIKGQTSQNGEPTPSSPIDVNVVSGSNIINTSNKNLFIPTLTYEGRNIETRNCTVSLQKDEFIFEASGSDMFFGYIGATNTTFSNSYGVLYEVLNNKTIRFTLSNIIFNKNYIVKYDENKKILGYQQFNSNTGTITFANDVKYYSFRIGYGSAVAGTIYKTKVQVELGSTATTYEPHQGKELPLNLLVENLFDKDDTSKILNAYIDVSNKTIKAETTARTLYIPIKPNTEYTISKVLSGRFIVGTFENYQIGTISNQQIISYNTKISGTITSGANDRYLCVFYYLSSADTLTEEEIRNSIQVEEGSKANAYTPYGTEPIELCKIGNYQDYFYKSGSKWYLHKETFKTIIPSSVNGTMQNSNKRLLVNKTQIGNYDILNTSSASQTFGLYCDILKEVTAGQTWSGTQGISYDYNASSGTVGFDFAINGLTTVAEYQEALAGKIIVAILNTPTDTEITNTTLISQLEAIYNAPLYEQTNITQENNDLPMVLDITACKDNINGIKAFIRK